jgi:hypothetical protein
MHMNPKFRLQGLMLAKDRDGKEIVVLFAHGSGQTRYARRGAQAALAEHGFSQSR